MKWIVFFIILVSVTFLFSQVNFELDFSFEKMDSDDSLTNLQLFDYNDDGIEEIVAFYRSSSYNNCWRMLCYTQNGSLLEEFVQENIDNEQFQKGYMYKKNDIKYILSTFRYKKGEFEEEVYLRLKLFDCASGSMVCELNYLIGIGNSDDTYTSYTFNTTDMFHQLYSSNDIIFYVGVSRNISTYTTMMSYSTSSSKSMLYKFLFSNNSISFVEEIENAGEKIYIYDLDYWLISTGAYFYHSWEEMEPAEDKYRSYRINLISTEIISDVEEVYYITGEYSNYYGEEIFEHYPLWFKVLTNNDLFYNDYGLSAYYKEEDTISGTSTHFNNFSLDFNNFIWQEEDSYIVGNQITTSTCISVNNEDHYVIYFSGGNLEIRNRNDGNIIHYQNSSILPFTIKRKSDEELLFFVGMEDETGYEAYILEDEIQVSSNESELSIIKYNLQNHPNPFNPSTTIQFSIPQESKVELTVYNIKGQKVKTIVDATCEMGINTYIWNGTNNFGNKVGTGIYFYQLKVDSKAIKTKKMMLIK
jgi:hypothetical protein